MPAVGDQHKPNGTNGANPFEEARPILSTFTAQEIATLQSRLDKQLGPEYISSRPGAAGQKVHYLAAEKVINLANEIFGFNGWSSSIQNIQIDFVDENAQTGKISLGLSVIIRVTLKDGTYHEDIGYGHIENCKGKAAAFEKAKKEGTTDGLKRALRTFGNVLGNCVYDKDYVAKVMKVKVGASKWDVEALHRHSDYVGKKELETKGATDARTPVPGLNDLLTTEVADQFDLADFDDAEFDDTDFGNPDEISLPAESEVPRPPPNVSNIPQSIKPPIHNGMTTPLRQSAQNMPSTVSRPLPGQGQSANQRLPSGAVNAGNPQLQRGALEGGAAKDLQQHSKQAQLSSSPGVPSQHFTGQLQNQNVNDQTNPRPAGFYSARAAPHIDAENNASAPTPNAVPLFNPHSESPSIRKTAGVDHRRSVPLKRDLKPDTSAPPNRDIIDPNVEPIRKTGQLGQAGQNIPAKGFNTSAYRPPTRRNAESLNNGVGAAIGTSPTIVGGVDQVLTAVKRSALSDVSNIQHNVTASTDDGADAKRQKVAAQRAQPPTGVENNVTDI